MARRPVFVCLLWPARPDFKLENITPEEQVAFQQHSRYHQQLLEDKKLIFSGPCLDGAFGLGLFEAESADEMRQIVEHDPLVTFGVCKPEWHPYHLGDIRVPEEE